MSELDYFAYRGYRKIVMRTLMQAIQDLMIKSNDAQSQRLRNEARDWIMYAPEATKEAADERRKFHVVGLTFSDCFYALGSSSNVKLMRDSVLSNPSLALRELKHTYDSISIAEGFFDESRNKRKDLKRQNKEKGANADGVANLVSLARFTVVES